MQKHMEITTEQCSDVHSLQVVLIRIIGWEVCEVASTNLAVKCPSFHTQCFGPFWEHEQYTEFWHTSHCDQDSI